MERKKERKKENARRKKERKKENCRIANNIVSVFRRNTPA